MFDDNYTADQAQCDVIRKNVEAAQREIEINEATNKPAREIAAHNIGFDVPRITHSRYVEFLYECAARWAQQPNGADQAQRVREQAEAMAKIPVASCAVCQIASKQ